MSVTRVAGKGSSAVVRPDGAGMALQLPRLADDRYETVPTAVDLQIIASPTSLMSRSFSCVLLGRDFEFEVRKITAVILPPLPRFGTMQPFGRRAWGWRGWRA